MLIIIEGLAMCFLLLVVCVIGIADGPVGLVVFYEDDVKKRVVEMGLITEERIKRNNLIASLAVTLPMLLLVPVMVYHVNGARGFSDIFWQITLIYWIECLFDRLFIDYYWVGHTKAWFIKGTEDLMPYIPKKTVIRKWLGTIIGKPVIALIVTAVVCFLSR